MQIYGPNISSRYTSVTEQAISELPLCGDVHSDKILTLAHYSPNRSIDSFFRSNASNWTGRLAFESKVLFKIIGFDYHKFEAVYFIKIGVNDINHSKGTGSGFMDEHSVRIEIQRGNFRRVDIKFNPETGWYDLE